MPEINEQESTKAITKEDIVSNSPKSSPTKKDIDVSTEALNHFSQGKRHLFVNDIPLAVNSLQEACRLLAKHYGETAIECADAYFYYGKALLELARIENGVLGNALDGVPEGEDENNSQIEDPAKMTEEEADTVSELVGEALEENFDTIEKGTNKTNGSSVKTEETPESSETENKEKTQDEDVEESVSNKTNGDEEKSEEMVKNGDSETKKTQDSEKTNDETEKMETDDDKDDEAAEETEEKDDEDAVEGEEDGEEPEADDSKIQEPEGEEINDADDVDNLQLAWEMLELSKLIYEKQNSSDSDSSNVKTKLAQAYMKLGEVGLESETYDTCVKDFEACLELQKKELSSDDRQLAETYYQIGVSYSLLEDFEKSIESFESASNVINQRITNLKKIQEDKQTLTKEQLEKEEKEKKDSLQTEQNEIEEIEKLLPEIEGKISDMKEMKKDSSERMKKLKDAAFAALLGGGSSVENGGASSSSAFSEETSAFSADSADKPVSNITHLVRKKRKPEDEADAKLDTKRPKENSAEVTPVLQNGDKKEDVNSKSDDTSVADTPAS